MIRTYRVQVTGQFDRPGTKVRQRLLTEQSAHDLADSAFTPEGTLSYTRTLTRFSFRYLLDIDEDSSVHADALATLEGEVRAGEYLDARGISFRPLTVTASCLQDVKIKRSR